MISGIFIARPRLAVVISVVITLAGAIAMTQIPIAQFPDIVPPQIAVTANYAGASAEVVEATVAQPIESRVIGVDRMLYMKSTSGNDGSYTLTVTFAVGTDPDLNTVKTQNRVGLAEPQLPLEVRSQGISVTKKSSALLQIVTMTSPDGRYDQLFLANYATINVIDSLKRVPGVGDVSMLTPADYSMKVWLNTDRMTSLGLTPNDIANAIKQPERPGCGRPHRRAAGAARSAVPAHHPDQGPAVERRRVRQYRAARQSGRVVRAGSRRGPGRAGGAPAGILRPAGRLAGRGDRHLPDPRRQRDQQRRPDSRDARTARSRRSRRASTTRSPTTPRSSSRKASAASCTRCSRRSPWWWSSSFSSSATFAPR